VETADSVEVGILTGPRSTARIPELGEDSGVRSPHRIRFLLPGPDTNAVADSVTAT
jgi:hypothetical protein